MEWIKLKDKKPDRDQIVLILDGEDIIQARYVYEEIYKQEYELAWYFYKFTPDGFEPRSRYEGGRISAEFVKFWMPLPNQPERSKREDSQQCEMRCSEHCGNTVRDK